MPRHRDAIEVLEVSPHVKAYIYPDSDAEEPENEPMGVCERFGPQSDYFPRSLDAKTRQYRPGCGVGAEEAALSHNDTYNDQPDYGALALHVMRNYGSPLYVLQCDRDRYDTGRYWAEIIQPVSRPSYDTSGYSADRWVMGYAFITPEDALTEFGCFAPLPKGAEHPFGRWIKAVLEERQQWADGDVYGYVVEIDGEEDFPTTYADNSGLHHGNYGDACWGFFGLEYAKEEAQRAAEYYVGYAEAKAAASFEGVS